MTWLADAAIDTHEYQVNLKSLLFICGFVMLCIVAAIWWLRR